MLVIVVSFTYFAFTVLAPWQLGKNRMKSEFNERLAHALEIDPVPAASVLNRDRSSVGTDKEWTRVSLQGRYLPNSEVLLRNRPINGTPSYQSFVAFRLANGLVVAVNRGWAPAGANYSIPALPKPTSAPTTLTGFIRMSEAMPDTRPVREGGYTQVTGRSTELLALAMKQRLAADYVQLDAASVGEGTGLEALPLPHLDNAQNLSYGIQWIAFGIMAPLALAWFVRAELRERRREQEEIAALGAEKAEDSSAATPAAATEAPAPQPRPRESARMYSRYGGTRPDFEAQRRAKKRERF